MIKPQNTATYLLALCTLTLAMQLSTAQTSSVHWPLDGDRVVKTQYEFVAVEADSAVWDFSSHRAVR